MTITYYIQVIASLLILSAIMLLVLKFTKRLQHQKFSGDIQVIDRSPIGQNAALLIVRVRENDYLISASPNQVVLLKDLKKEKTA